MRIVEHNSALGAKHHMHFKLHPAYIEDGDREIGTVSMDEGGGLLVTVNGHGGAHYHIDVSDEVEELIESVQAGTYMVQ